MSDLDDAGPIRLLDGADVDELATPEIGLEAALTAALLDHSRVATGRVQVNGQLSWGRILAGSLSELDVTGYKEFHRVGKRVRYHIHLFRESTGNQLGIVDGRRITSLRTSSTAAVAVRAWAGDRSVRVGVIGSGEEAREGLRAIHGALPVERATVYSPTPDNRRAFASEMGRALALEVTASEDQEGALRGADVLYVATSSKNDPIIGRSQLDHIPMVAAVGATQPTDRELCADVFSGATVVVDVLDAVLESGDGRAAMETGWDAHDSLLLGQYLDAPKPADRVLFKSIGSVEQDLVLALRLLQSAEERGIGRVIDPVGSLRLMR